MSEFDIPDATTDTSSAFERESTIKSNTYSERTERDTAGVGTQTGDSADEVNARQLLDDPRFNDVRWLYRTSIGKPIVDKPVDDSFKNGFDVKHDGERNVRTVLNNHDWVEHYKSVKKKTRRDGFALTYFVLDDTSASVGEDPLDDDVTVNDIHKLEIKTLDDMARYETSHGVIPAGAEADPLDDTPFEDYEIRPTGIVMDTDPMSETYQEPLGYLIGPPDWVDESKTPQNIKFYHRNRFIHHVENREVDGDLYDETLGRWEGDSTLIPVFYLLDGLQKGNWAIMQTIFRYAAKLYHVELPDDASEDDFDEAENEMQNLNAMSELITPAGYEIDDFQTDGQLQPEEYFDVIFEQICASVEMTKSVLFGTQTGTVSGSETDIKNYFNKVERMRQNEIANDMRDFVSMAIKLEDSRTSEQYDLQFEVDWGPLFKLSQIDAAERANRTMQTVGSAVNNFIMTPEEARSVLQEIWADVDIDWEDEFTDDEKDWLKTLNIAQLGTEAALPMDENVEVEGGSPRQGQNGGGMEQGTQTASEQPNTDSGLSDDDVQRIATQLKDMMNNTNE